MKEIRFYNFVIKEGLVKFEYCLTSEKQERKSNVYFELNRKFTPSITSVAYVMSTLIGVKKFTKAVVDLEVTKEVAAKIEKFVKTPVEWKGIVESDPTDVAVENPNNIILNFSGGLDSLAAYYLLPKDRTKLISVSFGGWFVREENFFKKFNPLIVRTNLRYNKTGANNRLNENSWTFMGCGALLCKNYSKAKYNVFGSILEGTVYHLIPTNTVGDNNNTPPFGGYGLYDLRVVNGITEVATTIISSYYGADLMHDAIESLAAPKTEKKYRKQLLLDIICEKFGRKIDIKFTEPPVKKIKFGTYLTTDFLCLYILKNRGLEAASQTVSDIPQSAVELVKNLDLTFFERMNCDFIDGKNYPDNELRGYVIGRAIEAGVLPYTEKDYKEYRIVTNLLNEYHHFDKSAEKKAAPEPKKPEAAPAVKEQSAAKEVKEVKEEKAKEVPQEKKPVEEKGFFDKLTSFFK